MISANVIHDFSRRTRFLIPVIGLLVVSVVCASTRAKLSMYDPPGSQSRITAMATKLHECKMNPVQIAPEQQVVEVLPLPEDPPVPKDLPRPVPVSAPHYGKSLFLRPPPAFA